MGANCTGKGASLQSDKENFVGYREMLAYNFLFSFRILTFNITIDLAVVYGTRTHYGVILYIKYRGHFANIN